MINKIALLIDFTGVCQLAMEHTALLARQSLSQVTLLHIAAADQQANDKEIKNQIREFAQSLENEGIPFAIHVDYGDFFDIIGESVRKQKADLLIVGTHGIKGIKANFQSSAILRLMGLIDTPALVVQGHSQTPLEGYLNILIPLVGKVENADLIDPVSRFASVFKSHVQILSFFHKENETERREDTRRIESGLLAKNVKVTTHLDETSVYTSNYYRSIIEFADIEEANLIVLAVHESGDSGYFNETDEENLLLNRLGTAVLCL
ncbi:MAG: universal stress protein [Bacteroidetes bacterium]|nr:universal stress protein [Bacteroidota bacterium]